ncbi:UDP-glucose/GDP-mannose dehydrogenase family protein [Nocardioides maradonensis]
MDHVEPRVAGPIMRVCVIGTGYVGLTAGACFAVLGHQVVCTDCDASRVEQLRDGTAAIVEPGLAEIVGSMTAAGRLRFGTSNTDAVSDADVVVLCLPTPQGNDGSADLAALMDAVSEIAPHLRPGAVLVEKSTVPVGTARRVRRLLGREDIAVVANPEFLAEGSAVRDFLHPDRIVIGSDDIVAARRVMGLYDGIDTEVVVTDTASAETIKYAANAYLAVRLSFVNSMAEVCEVVGADIDAVMEGVGTDHRIGRHFLRPGPGWGGSCFPKDTSALMRTSLSCGFDFTLLRAAMNYNVAHREWMVAKVLGMLGPREPRTSVAIWGLTFKAGTDDLRDSPAMVIAERLASMGLLVRAYDPTVQRPVRGIGITESCLDACRGARVLVIATEWPEFAEVDLAAVAQVMAEPNIVDLRNILDPEDVLRHGFRYDAVGRGQLGVGALSVAAG